MLRFLRSPYLGHAIAIFAVALAGFFYLRPFDHPEISFDYSQSLIIDRANTTVVDKSVLPLASDENVYLGKLIVWNSGQRDLRPDDIRSSSLIFPRDIPIVITQINSNSNYTPAPKIESNSITEIFTRLNVDHSIHIDFLYASNELVEPLPSFDAAGFKAKAVDIAEAEENRDGAIQIVLAVAFAFGVIFVTRTVEAWKKSENPTLATAGVWLSRAGLVFSAIFMLSMLLLVGMFLVSTLGSWLVGFPQS